MAASDKAQQVCYRTVAGLLRVVCHSYLYLIACTLYKQSSIHPAFSSTWIEQVLVTGAAGKTGQLVLKRLLNLPDRFAARALVHTDKVCASC